METHDQMHDHGRDGLRNFLTVVFKHKYKVITVFVVAMMAAVLASFLPAPVYEAQSSLLVKIGREYLNRTEPGENKPVLSVNNEQVINSEIEILTNGDLIRNVISRLTIARIYPDLAESPPPNQVVLGVAAARFRECLTVEGVKKSNVLRVSFRHQDPKVAAQAVNTLVELYKEKHLQVFSDPKSSFLEKQLETYNAKLQESEKQLETYKQKNRVYSIEEQKTLLLKQRAELDATSKNSEHSIVELQKRVLHLRNQLQAISESKTRYTSSDRDRIIVEAKAKLLALQLEEQELLKKYSAQNHLVVNIKKEVALVKTFIAEQEADNYAKVKSGNLVYQNVEMDLIKAETDLSSQKGKVAALRRQVRQLDQEIESLDLSERELQTLKRAQIINERNYQTYIAKTEEARILEDMDRLKLANISVIQDAAVPMKPVKPNRGMTILLGLFAGCVGGLGVAFCAESAAQTFSAPAAVERRLGVPVLATVSKYEG